MKKKINKIEIEGITYVPESETKEYDGDYKIVVLQRGWVYVGILERDGMECKLHNTYNIRKWGTTKGLGELVNGRLSDTVLDRCGLIEFHWLTVINTITINEDKWKSVLV